MGRHEAREGDSGRIGRGDPLVDPRATPQETGKHAKPEVEPEVAEADDTEED